MAGRGFFDLRPDLGATTVDVGLRASTEAMAKADANVVDDYDVFDYNAATIGATEHAEGH